MSFGRFLRHQHVLYMSSVDEVPFESSLQDLFVVL